MSSDKPTSREPTNLHVPPSAEDWARFMDGLAFAREIKLRKVEVKGTGDLSHDLGSILQALTAVLELLQTQDGAVRAGLPLPFVELAGALSDLLVGQAPALLTPSRKGRPGKGFSDSYLMALSALAAEELIASGERRPSAGQKVARAIEGAKLAARIGSRSGISGTILGWRDRLREGQGSAPAGALELWVEYHQGGKELFGPTSSVRAQTLLRMIRNGEVVHWS